MPFNLAPCAGEPGGFARRTIWWRPETARTFMRPTRSARAWRWAFIPSTRPRGARGNFRVRPGRRLFVKEFCMIRLSVLDQSPIRSGGTAADAVRETLALAEAAERLGYHRYWVAEHHNTGGFAGSTPEILVGQVAARTRTMRVGTGGVMLSHYSPLKVAENFRMLETLYPGRIDLGIGRAPGSDRLTAMALACGPGAAGIERFPDQLSDLFGFLRNEMEPAHPFEKVRAVPEGPTVPEVWLLGSSDQSAAFAAHFGCAYSFAHFIGGEGAPIMRFYRENFRPSPGLAKPLESVGVFVMCAGTEEEARYHAEGRALWFLRVRTGQRTAIPSPEEALAHPYSEVERHFVQDVWRRTVAGDPEQVKARLLEMSGAYGVEEFVVVTVCHSFEARLRSYELLAEAFGLKTADRKD